MRKTVEKIAGTDPGYAILSDISNPAAYLTAITTHIHHWSGRSTIGSVVDQWLMLLE